MQELYGSAGMFLMVLVVAMLSLFLNDDLLRIGVAVSAAAQAYGTALLVSAGHKFYLVIAHG